MLKRRDFKDASREDLLFYSEKTERKKVLDVYNKQLADFNGDVDRFDEYLTEVEDLIDALLGTQEQRDKAEKKLKKKK